MFFGGSAANTIETLENNIIQSKVNISIFLFILYSPFSFNFFFSIEYYDPAIFNPYGRFL